MNEVHENPLTTDGEHEGASSAARPSAEPTVFDSWPYVDRRRLDDRRHVPTSAFFGWLHRGRRKRGRRFGEEQNIYVDLYGREDVLLVAFILVLNILDAYFTLDYVRIKSGREANPVADLLLKMGNDYFIYAKCVLVMLSLVFLLVHKTFRYVTAALWLLFAFYGVLFFYHLFLQVEFVLGH